MSKKIISNKHKISKEHRELFVQFLESANAARLSRNLRDMLLLWLQYEKGGYPTFLDDLLFDLGGLFTLLDGLEDSNVEKS